MNKFFKIGLAMICLLTAGCHSSSEEALFHVNIVNLSDEELTSISCEYSLKTETQGGWSVQNVAGNIERGETLQKAFTKEDFKESEDLNGLSMVFTVVTTDEEQYVCNSDIEVDAEMNSIYTVNVYGNSTDGFHAVLSKTQND